MFGRHGSMFGILLTVASAGCMAEAGAVDSNEFDSVEGGKFDMLSSAVEALSPEACAVVRMANELTPATLDAPASEGGVALRASAADAIAAFRAGPDGTLGTSDDRRIESLDDLGAIQGIGPASINALWTYASAHGAVREPFRVATFNMRWFGRNGYSSNPLGSETRTSRMRSITSKEFADRDLIVFEEVSDLDLLTDDVMPEGWGCTSYGDSTAGTQRVVMCLRDRYELRVEASDTNHVYEPLGAGWLRPGVYGVVYDTETSRALAHVMGVHLKADTNSADKRLEQAGEILNWFGALEAAKDTLPVVVLGDFNTHRAAITGGDADEWDVFDAMFAPSGVRLYDHPFNNTYISSQQFFRFDHLFRSEQVCVAGARLYGPCDGTPGKNTSAVATYASQVSDHCPVLVDLDL